MTINVSISGTIGSDCEITDYLKNGAATAIASPTATSFILHDTTASDNVFNTNVDLLIQGTGFTYSGGAVTGGIITGIQIKPVPTPGTTVSTITGLHIDAAALYTAAHTSDTATINQLFFQADSFNYTGGTGKDIFTGGSLNDTISGGAGNDTLSGGNGDDTIQGGAGADILDGGAGNDTVSYAASATGVTVDLNIQDGFTAQAGAAGSSDAAGDVLNSFEAVTGSALADTLTASDATGSTLSGGAGNDILHGGASDDTLIGGAGADTMDGGAGNDTVSYAGSTVAVTVTLGAGGAQTLGVGGDAAGDKISNIENITGGGGNDVLTGNELDNILQGGNGDDTLVASAGNDTYDGGAGNDTVSYAAAYFGSSGGVTVDLTVQGNGNPQTVDANSDSETLISIENITGSSGNDVLTGNAGANTLSGGLGNDTISGGGGNDTLDGGAGATLTTGGSDTVDYSYLTSGQNITVTLGALTVATGAVAATTTSGVAGDIDKISNFENITGGDGNDVLTGNAGVNIIAGGAGDDVIQGGAGADILDGGTGNNTVSYAASLKAVTVDLNIQDGSTAQAGAAGSSDAAGDVLSNFQNVTGSALADTLSGDSNDNVLNGGLGNDILNGGDGNDTLIGGAGADTMDGGDGVSDTVSYLGSATAVTVTLGAGGAQTLGVGGDAAGDKISNIENITGGGGNDVLTGNELDNILQGGNGDDTLVASAGNDTYDGGAGNDTVSYAAAYFGSSGGVTVDLTVQGNGNPQTVDANSDSETLISIENITGSSGNDVLTGNAGANTLSGGLGNDTISGGGGNDTLDGGAGATLTTGGSDTVDYSYLTSGQNITVTLGALTVATGAVAATTTSGVAGDIDKISNFENITGGDGNDVLTGNAGVNIIAGGAGDDVIQGGAGADILDGGTGNNTVSYAASLKAVTVDLNIQDGSTAQAGAAGSSDAAGDVLSNFQNVTGSALADTLSGDSNDNVLNGGLGNDILNGGDGNDTLIGGAGADTMDGGDGVSDTVSYLGSATAVTVTLGAGGAQTLGVGGDAAGDRISNIENITGGSGNDVLTGNELDNILRGGGGNDTLIGGPGQDTLDGGTGVNTASYVNDTAGVTVDLHLQDGVTPQSSPGSEADGDILTNIQNLTGGSGNDVLTGDGNANVLSGGLGDDTIDGGAGNDILSGGAGNDTVSYASATGNVTVNLALTTAQNTGGAGTDTLSGFENLTGGDFNDVLTGSTGVNVISGGLGDDTITGGAGADVLDGGGDNDTVSYAASTQAVTINLGGQGTYINDDPAEGRNADATAQVGGDAQGDMLWGFRNVTGTALADTLTGDDNDNILSGGAGNDILNGGAGNDTLIGGAGADTMDGGDGVSDTVSYLGSATAVTVTLGAGGAQTLGVGGDAAGDKISNIENITGGNGNDVLTGNAADNILRGGPGDDTLYGGGGNDLLDGGLGNDTVTYKNATAGVTVDLRLQDGVTPQSSPGSEADGNILVSIENLTGSGFDDVLIGNSGANKIDGGAGNDIIDGGGGNDTLTGGAGNDTFVFEPGSGTDTIVGFEHGKDHVDLTAFNFSTLSFTSSSTSATVNLAGGDKIIFTGIVGGALTAADFGFADASAPTARADIVSATEDTPTTFLASTLTSNDLDPASGGVKIISGVADVVGGHGHAVLNGSGNVDFTPDANFSGKATFTYTVQDINGGATDTATVTVNVAPVADAPTFTVGTGGGDPTPIATSNDILVSHSGSFSVFGDIYSLDMPTIAADGSGNFVITWAGVHEDNIGGPFPVDNENIYAQRFDNSGNKVGGQVEVNPDDSANQHTQWQGDVVALPGVGYLTTFIDWSAEGNSSAGIYAERFDTSGQLIGGRFHVNTTTTGDQEQPTAAAFSDGSFVVVWRSEQNSSNGDIYGQLFLSNGTANGTEFEINTTSTGVNQPSVATLDNNGFVVTWQGEDNSSLDVIYAQQYNSDGSKNGSEFRVDSSLTETQDNVVVTGLTGGGYVVAWQGFDSTFSSNTTVFAKVYDNTGATVTDTFLVPANIIGEDVHPTVTALADGGFFVSWMDGVSGSYDIYGQRFDATGKAIGDQIKINDDTTSPENVVGGKETVTQLANGDLAATWLTGSGDIYTRTFTLPTADAATASGNEDTAIALPAITAAVTDTDGSESIKVVISGFPPGATFSKGALDAGSGNWIISDPADVASLAGTPLTVTPPNNYSGNFHLSIEAVVSDTALLTSGTATSQATTAAQTVDVTVIGTGSAPVITSSGGGATATASTPENTTAVTTVQATDPDGHNIVYSLVNTDDFAKFNIDPSTGALSFKSPPDFENPQDVGGTAGDNKYVVTVQATDARDANLFDTQSITVTVTNLNEAPVIDSNSGGTTGSNPTFSTSIAENTTAVATVHATDPENAAVTYSIVGGDDASKFSIVANTGVLKFIAAPNYEAPTDLNKDNAYVVIVQASDGTLVDTQTITVNVANKDEFAPVISSNSGGATASITLAENTSAVTTVHATDADTNDAVTYSISGGTDAALFTINASTGALSFISAPNFENPAHPNNIYNVTVQATDSGATYDPATGALSDTQAIAITVTDVNEFAPVITSNGGGDNATVKVTDSGSGILAGATLTTVVATDADGTSHVSYSIIGGADAALFTINASTGVLTFKTTEHAANPADANKDNEYLVTVQASDGSKTDTQNIDVSVFGADHAPTINVSGVTAIPLTLSGGGATVPTLVGSPILIGGSGDQHGEDIVYDSLNHSVYLAYNGSQNSTGHEDGTVVAYDATNLGGGATATSQTVDGNYNGVALAPDNSGLFAVGLSFDMTNDSVGGKEIKTFTATLDSTGNAAGAGVKGHDPFFSYSGVEFFEKDIGITVGGTNYYIAVGVGQPVSYDAYLVAKYDSSGNLVAAATDSSVGINLPNGYSAPIPGSSGAFGVAADASNDIWVVGYSQWPTEGDKLSKPTVWEYDSSLNLVARFKDTQETGLAGAYYADVVDNANHALYAVGYDLASSGGSSSQSFLVSKFDTTTGQLLWTHHFGGDGSDILTDAIMVNGRLFAVGQQAVGGHGLDAVLVEIDPNTGNVLNTTTIMGGTGDDVARSITTDGANNLYIAGETNTGGANGIDAFIVKYSIGSGTAQTGFHFALPNTAIGDVDAAPTDQLKLTITVTNGTFTPTGSVLTPTTTLNVTDTLSNLNADVANGIDYLMNNGSTSGTLTLTVNDQSSLIGGPKSVTQVFQITPTGLDAAPTDIQLSNNAIAENSAVGTVIGTLTATDPDGPANEAFTFTLLSGGDSAPFQIVGNKLEMKSVLNFEAPSDANHDNLYDFTIQVAETANPTVTFQETVEVQITDVAEGAAATINGTAGNDFITNASDNSTIPAGYNVIRTATDGAEIINGLAGNDIIKGWGGDDQLFGGAGNDILIGGAGNDLLNGGPVLFDGISAAGWGDINTASYALSPNAITADLGAGTVTGSGNDTLVNIEGIIGTAFDDTLSGGSAAFVESFQGGGGNDVINGRGGLDKAVYSDATSGITVNLAAGIVDGTAGGVGVDNLRSVEWIVGSSHDDTYDATGFGPFSANEGNFVDGRANIFTPGGGNDTVLGNGLTILDYSDVNTGFTANLGTTTITTAFGTTTFAASSVMGVVGGAGNDTLIGSDVIGNLNGDGNGPNFELFAGGPGNDTIDGGKGLDIAVYNYFAGPITAGISVNLAAGTVTGLDANTQALIGTDTLRNVEGVWGTVLNDTFNATGFTGTNAGSPSTNAGDGFEFLNPNAGPANFFDGGAGNDTIIGNGFTVLQYFSATSGITVNFSTTTAGSGTTTGNASVGTDTFTGVFMIQGTPYDDRLVGGAGSQSLSGNGGNDILIGGAGDDMLDNGTVDYSSASAAVVINLSSSSQTYTGGAGSVQGQTGQSFAVTDTANVGHDQLSNIKGVIGSNFDDIIIGGTQGGNAQIFRGGAGNDTIIGQFSNGGQGAAFQLSDYSDATGGVAINLSNVGGTLHGSATGQGVGTDTLININEIRGSNFADTYDATAISQTNNGQDFNQFEGGGGNDLIKGNGNTWVSYAGASAGVAVNLDSSSHSFTYNSGVFTQIDNGGANTVAGATATSIGANDAAKIGTDTFTTVPSIPSELGVNVVIGSNFDDILIGSAASGQDFFGGLGNDYINGGGGGGDRVDYFVPLDNVQDGQISIGGGGSVPWGNLHGLTIDLAAGTVIGDPLLSGTDTIRSIEIVTGSRLGDIYNASGFGATSVNAGSGTDPNFNEFIVSGGNNTIIGNGDTTISYEIINGSVSVDLAAGTADRSTSLNGPFSNDSSSLDSLGGHDTITGGVNEVIGSSNDDFFRGTVAAETFSGGSGINTITYDNATSAVTVNLQLGTAIGGGGSDALINIENVGGSNFDDVLIASNTNNVSAVETFYGGAGNDTIIGGTGYDRADYNPAYYNLGSDGPLFGADGISVNLAAGTVFGETATAIAAVGQDTLQSIESVFGTNANDVFDATGFSGSSTNAGSDGKANDFQGFGGNDTFTGNGFTQVDYFSATAAVVVNLDSTSHSYTDNNGVFTEGSGTTIAASSAQSFDGAGTDSAHIGLDTFVSGINAVVGSNYNDLLIGSSTNGSTTEIFTGEAGNDFIDGNGGFDRASYNFAGETSVTVDLGAGTAVANDGTDTLRSIDSIEGTPGNDVFDASGFTDSSVNAGESAFNNSGLIPLNEFIGMGGDDTITGNGNTRVSYEFASGPVTVNLASGSGSSSGADGNDTFISGVTIVRGSSHDDTFIGGAGGQRFQGGLGNDTMSGGGGNDQFEYSNPNEGGDTITDFTTGADRFRINVSGFTDIGSGLVAGESTANATFGGFNMLASYFTTVLGGNESTHGEFIFDTTNASDHILYWDSDGTGPAAQILIAHVGTATIQATDFNLH